MKLIEFLHAITEIVTDEDTHTFTCGSCLFFAWVLHKKLGWDIKGIASDFREAERSGDGYPDDLVHVWVEKNGKAIDINGVHDANGLRQHYMDEAGHMGIKDASPFDFEPWFLKGFLEDLQWGPDETDRTTVLKRALQIVNWMKGEYNLHDSVGGNEGELNSEDDEPRPPPESRDEEGHAGWDWTDPYHSSGTTNAVLSGTP